MGMAEAYLKEGHQLLPTQEAGRHEVCAYTQGFWGHAAVINNYRAFVQELVCKSAGGPPAQQLVDAIEDNTVSYDAVHYMTAGFPFDSYTKDPPCPT